MENEGSGPEIQISGFFTETRLPSSPRFGIYRLFKFLAQNTSFSMCVTQTV